MSKDDRLEGISQPQGVPKAPSPIPQARDSGAQQRPAREHEPEKQAEFVEIVIHGLVGEEEGTHCMLYGVDSVVVGKGKDRRWIASVPRELVDGFLKSGRASLLKE